MPEFLARTLVHLLEFLPRHAHLDAATRAHARTDDVGGVKVISAVQVVGVEVGFVLGVFGVAAVSSGDDGVQQIGENLVRFLVTGYATDREDKRMTCGEILSILLFYYLYNDTKCPFSCSLSRQEFALDLPATDTEKVGNSNLPSHIFSVRRTFILSTLT